MDTGPRTERSSSPTTSTAASSSHPAHRPLGAEARRSASRGGSVAVAITQGSHAAAPRNRLPVIATVIAVVARATCAWAPQRVQTVRCVESGDVTLVADPVDALTTKLNEVIRGASTPAVAASYSRKVPQCFGLFPCFTRGPWTVHEHQFSGARVFASRIRKVQSRARCRGRRQHAWDELDDLQAAVDALVCGGALPI